MAEAVFYQLTRKRLEQALPDLLAKTLAKGWRAVVRCGAEARVENLNQVLWSFADESFLPHGTAADGEAERQPIYLTAGGEVPNNAEALFLVDGASADPEEMRRFERCVLMFDGRNEAMLQAARGAWKAVTNAEIDALYWAEKSGGGWEKKAEKRAGDAAQAAAKGSAKKQAPKPAKKKAAPKKSDG